MAPPTSGTYAILSALMGDHRFVQNNNNLLQLEYVKPGSGYSDRQKFQVTLTGDGSYTIQSLTGGGGSGIWYQMDQSGDPESGDFILYVFGNGAPVRWRIEQAPDVGPTVMNIIGVHGVADGPLARYPLWNRIDGDDAGRLQLMNPGGGPDPHNNWIFLPA